MERREKGLQQMHDYIILFLYTNPYPITLTLKNGPTHRTTNKLTY